MMRSLVVLNMLLIACGSCNSVDLGPLQTNCSISDLRVGQEATLIRREHGVSGVARIVDDCTIVLENFFFDGGGLDVRVVGASDSNLQTRTILSNNLVRLVGYNNETLSLALPVGKTLSDVQWISIYCITVRASFGDGQFQ